MSDRNQSCYVEGQLSSALSLFSCGVPQGSIGGPLLWLCFTCDQPDVIHDHVVDGQDLHRGCSHDVQGQERERQVDLAVQDGDCGTLVGYVDDGAYSFGHSDPHVVSQVLTSRYTLLENWMNSNRLVINPEKTHLMVLESRRMRPETVKVSVQVRNLRINPTDNEKNDCVTAAYQTLIFNNSLHFGVM